MIMLNIKAEIAYERRMIQVEVEKKRHDIKKK
jgi:hypothetical protein